MISSLGQCIALATHANAKLSGRDVQLDLATHPWFKNVAIDFRVGEEGRSYGKTFKSWTNQLQSEEFFSAYLWVEPFDRSMKTINLMAFAGFARWAPVTVVSDAEVIWHEKLDTEPQPWQSHRQGFLVMPDQESIVAGPVDSTARLDATLQRVAAFQRSHFAEEPFADRFFDPARRILNGVEVAESARSLFPDGYPQSSLRLAGAAHAGWTFGGMGWWNDRFFSEPGLQKEFEELTFEYYESIAAALVAACAFRYS